MKLLQLTFAEAPVEGAYSWELNTSTSQVAVLQGSDEIEIVATDPMPQCMVVGSKMNGYVVPSPRL